MIVSHSRRFVFVHIPKCAGTSFRNALKPYHDDTQLFWYRRFNPYFGCEVDFAHLRLWELHALFPNVFDAMSQYETLALVRSPYDRFISALGEYFAQFHPELDDQAADRAALRSHAERFIESELRMERVLGNGRFIHFSLQTWYIMLGERRLVRHVLPVPRDDKGWSPVFDRLGIPAVPVDRWNRRSSRLKHLLQVGGILEWIEEFYKPDFTWLRSEPDVAGLAARPHPADG